MFSSDEVDFFGQLLMNSSGFELEKIKNDHTLAYCAWLYLVKCVTLQNLEKTLSNCLAILSGDSNMDYNNVLEDLSFVLYKLNVEDASSISDDSWRSILSIIQKCLSEPTKILEKVSNRTLLPIVGHLYARLLSILCSQRCNDIRLNVIEAIHSLIYHFDKQCVEGRSYASALRASYISKILPGLAQSLLTSVVTEKGRNSIIKAKALTALGKLMVVCFGTDVCESVKRLDKERIAKLELSDFSSLMKDSVEHLVKLVHLCLASVFAEVITYSASAKERLYSAVLTFSSDVLSSCWEFLNLNTESQAIRDDLLRALIIVNVEDGCSTFNKASSLLSDIAERKFTPLDNRNSTYESLFPPFGGEVMHSISFQIILDISKDIENSLQGCRDENITRSLLSRLTGVVRFLGSDGVSSFIGNRINLQNFLTTLCKYLEIQLDDICLVDQIRTLSPADQLFRKQFVHFRNPANLHEAFNVVRLLTSSCNNFDFISEMLLEIANIDEDLETSALVLFSAPLSALSTCDDQSRSERVSLALTAIGKLSDRNYLQLQSDFDQSCVAQWPLSVNPTVAKAPAISWREQRRQCLNTCIFMECIVAASSIWGSSEEQAVYPDEIFPYIMQMFCLATCDGLISSTAQRALLSISTNCGYSGLADFLSAASESILSSLTIDFHAVLLAVPSDDTVPSSALMQKLQQTCSALSYFVDHTDLNVIDRLQPLVMQMLLCMDLSYQFAAPFFVAVLRKVIALCTRVCSSLADSKLNSTKPRSVCSSEYDKGMGSMVDRLLNRKRNRILLSVICERTLEKTSSLFSSIQRQQNYIITGIQMSDDQEASDEKDVSESVSDKPNSQIPHLRLVEEIMLRCTHMMSSNEPRIKVASMCLLSDGCAAIADENVLLPLVHKMWSPLLSRIRDRQPIIVEKAFELFSTLTSVAGTFIRSRVSSDLIPSLVSFLQKGVPISFGATSSYECLTVCSVQKRLLYALGPICVQLSLFSNVLQPVVNVLSEYIERDQPTILREAAAHSLIRLCELDPGVVMYEMDRRGFV